MEGSDEEVYKYNYSSTAPKGLRGLIKLDSEAVKLNEFSAVVFYYRWQGERNSNSKSSLMIIGLNRDLSL